MSFSRLNYDDCTYKHTLKQSIGPAEYMLGRPRNDCDGGCFAASPEVALGGIGAAVCDSGLVDVDSELMGITRKASRCPADKYLPTYQTICETKMPRDCGPELIAEPTRISNGPCTLRGTGWNRWEWLCKDPQESALMPFDAMINNRLIVKDAHRPCLPKPADQSASLPPKENENVCYDWSSKFCKDPPPVSAYNPPDWHLSSCAHLRAL